MRLDFNVLLLAFSALTQSLPSHHKRDTDLASLQGLTKLDRDHSFKDDPLEKYFHEADVRTSPRFIPQLHAIFLSSCFVLCSTVIFCLRTSILSTIAFFIPISPDQKLYE